MFDAYTIKKVLPRLLAAAILIQLSWPLFAGLVYIVGQIAWGIEGLLYAPFGGIDELQLGVILEDVAGNGTFTTVLLGGAAWLAMGAPGLLALAAGALLAIFVAVFVLSIRQVVLILLLVTSPLALVAWILPNTEKVWKMWWGTFSKLLLMYPLIILLVASGRISARVVANTDISQLTKFIIVVIAFFGPFFLISKTFQFAGGAISAVGGALDARKAKITGYAGKRAIGKQGQKWGERKQKAKTGDLFSGSKFIPGSNFAADKLNRFTRGAGAGIKFGDKRTAYMDSMSFGASEDLMKDKNFTGIMYDDEAMRAMTYSSKAQAEKELAARYKRLDPELSDGDAMKRAQAAAAKASLVGFGGTRAVAAAQRLAMNKTGYGDGADAIETIDRVSGGNSSLNTSLKENIKFTSKQVGRSDLGALSSRNVGESHDDWVDRMALDGASTADDATLARNHKNSMEIINRAVQRQHGRGTELSGKASEVAGDLSRARDWATRGNKEMIDEMGGLPSGREKEDVVQHVQENPDQPGELIIRTRGQGTGREATISEIARGQGSGATPNDPSAPNNQNPDNQP
jgi:hypothetical protein